MESQPRVLILCRNRLLRESITRIVCKRTDFQLAASLSPGADPVDEISKSAADIVVCDSLLSILGGDYPSPRNPDAKQRIKSILVAMDDNPENFLTAVRHGVLGYVLQEASAAEVVSAIRVVAEGGAVCPSRFIKVLFDSFASQVTEPSACSAGAQVRLTRREQQLIPLINRGLTNKEIANQLNVSEQTIKTHVHRILHKVGAEGRQSLSGIRYYPGESTPGVFQS